jgi:hypothetical protein
MSRPALLLSLAAIALGITACTVEVGEPVTGNTADVGELVTGGTAEIKPTPGSTPQALLERAPLHLCGEFTLRLGEQVPASATECFENAIGAGGAELILTAPTDEGDPVVSWFRALPTGGVEIWTDVRQDKFAGEAAWQHSLCPSADSWLPESSECTQESFS